VWNERRIFKDSEGDVPGWAVSNPHERTAENREEPLCIWERDL
jgi:hypothetical protein